MPADYAGVGETDRGKSYDAEEFNAVSHHWERIFAEKFLDPTDLRSPFSSKSLA
jgi:hypothetical protein